MGVKAVGPPFTVDGLTGTASNLKVLIGGGDNEQGDGDFSQRGLRATLSLAQQQQTEVLHRVDGWRGTKCAYSSPAEYFHTCPLCYLYVLPSPTDMTWAQGRAGPPGRLWTVDRGPWTVGYGLWSYGEEGGMGGALSWETRASISDLSFPVRQVEVDGDAASGCGGLWRADPKYWYWFPEAGTEWRRGSGQDEHGYGSFFLFLLSFFLFIYLQVVVDGIRTRHDNDAIRCYDMPCLAMPCHAYMHVLSD